MRIGHQAKAKEAIVTKEVEGKFARIHKKLPHVARVTVRVADNLSGPNVTVRCTAAPVPFSQGNIEDETAEGYDDWKQGAVIGAQYALDVAGRTSTSVVISRIVGMMTDTNPTIVGGAAAYGVWLALDYSPTPEQIRQIEQVVLSSWQRPFDALPDFCSVPD